MSLALATPNLARAMKGRHSAYMTSFYLHNKPVGNLLLSPLCRQRNPRLERLSTLPKVTQKEEAELCLPDVESAL